MSLTGELISNNAKENKNFIASESDRYFLLANQIKLPEFLQTISADFQIIFERDPAAKNWFEVLLCYPGFHALLCYRIAHCLHNVGTPFIRRRSKVGVI